MACMFSDYIGLESMHESLGTCLDSSGGVYEWNMDWFCLSHPSRVWDNYLRCTSNGATRILCVEFAVTARALKLRAFDVFLIEYLR